MTKEEAYSSLLWISQALGYLQAVKHQVGPDAELAELVIAMRNIRELIRSIYVVLDKKDS